LILRTSPSSPGSEVLTLPQSGPVSEASDRLNRINMPCVSCETGSVDGSPDGQTSAIYRQVTLSGELASTARPSSAGDSPASRSASPGSEEARQMTVTSGRKCLESCGSSGPLGSLERMLLVLSAWNSNLAVLTWKVKGIPSGRSLFQLAASVPCTEENGCLLWPTPTAPGSHQVGRIEEWGGSGNPLRIYPTPTARDYRAPGLPEKRQARMEERAQPLPEVIGGMLNPQWVEWLMGFPIGWTDCDVSAMQSCHNKSIRSLRVSHRLNRRR
jgi:hypothetical protein